MTIIDHFEKSLGPIQQGWRETAEKAGASNMMVARFANVPFENASTFATIGLGDHMLHLTDGRQLRQELIFAAHDIYSANSIASFLLTFSEFVRSQSRALARGDVIGPSSALIPNVVANAVYACPPVIFPDGLDLYGETSPPTIIVWLLPLVGNESFIAKKNGGDYFEDLLEHANPDLLDLNRTPIVS